MRRALSGDLKPSNLSPFGSFNFTQSVAMLARARFVQSLLAVRLGFAAAAAALVESTGARCAPKVAIRVVLAWN